MFSLILPVFLEKSFHVSADLWFIDPLKFHWLFWLPATLPSTCCPKVVSPLLDYIKGTDHTTIFCLHCMFADCFQANHAFHRSFGKPGRTATPKLEGSWFTSQLQKMCKTYTEWVQPPDGRTQLIGGVGSNTWPPAGWYSNLQPQGVKCSTQNQSWVSLVAEQSNNLWYHMAQTIF